MPTDANAVSDLVSRLRESPIREISRATRAAHAVNLVEGFPDEQPPEAVVHAVVGALLRGANHYSHPWGEPELRRALSGWYGRHDGFAPDPEHEITVTCGATEATLTAFLGLLGPGDEVVMFDPAYESYEAHARMAGARPVIVPLAPDGRLPDADALRAAVGPRTRLIVVNTPHNPTGRVADSAELALIGELAARYGCHVLVDEVYREIHYLPEYRSPIAELRRHTDRVLVVGALSKTYAATGWRLGWLVAPAPVSAAARKIHDYVTAAAPTPQQAGALAALQLPESYYGALRARYRERRDFLCGELTALGLGVTPPQAGLFVLADVTPAGFADGAEFARAALARGVGVVAMSAFRLLPQPADPLVRLCFARDRETLALAMRRLRAGGQAGAVPAALTGVRR